MDERESSVASSTDFYETEAKPTPSTASTVAKRKAEDDSSAQDKKRKRDSPSPPVSSDLRRCVGLPPPVWQHVFLFCSLADLGRLMQVNRSFFSYLTDVRNVSVSKPDSTCLRLLKSESVWASARNALSPRPPKPLAGFTELQMWQLAWSQRCQFCTKLGLATSGDDIWQQGPGENGVRVIWPFGIRACGPCLLQHCQTDSSLLFSQTASALRPGLPFALITKDGHQVPAHVVQSKTPPLHVEIGKYYYKAQVEEMTRELDEALSLGPAAAEEWSKGLEARGKERMKIAENWERWQGKYRSESKKHAASVAVAAPFSRSPVRHSSPVIHTPIPMPPTSQYAHARPPTVPPQIFTPQPGQTGSTQPSHQRNLHDANEAKASRKTDIERRCQQMNPPIPPNVLRHMESFKAAIQISQPMNDYAWSVLEPRLVAQLPAAQQAEAEHVSRVASSATKPAERRYQDANSKEAKETMDREWEEAQRPIRDKLNAIADDFISQDWDYGKAVTYDNSPKFAADVLIYVRRMYLGNVPTEGASRENTEGSDNANNTDLSKPKLVLENMKWVYDNKIKPLTEQFRKDLYLCSASNCDSGTRYYGFEGIVQHFGAKHTHAFSSGNVVVAWRDAAWPEETPFHPDPISVKHAYHASNASGYGYFGGYSRAGTSTPHMPPHLPQASPGPYQYGGQYNGPFPPPQATGPVIAGYDYAQQYPAPLDNYSYQTMGPPGYGTQMGGASYMPSPALGNPTIPPPPPAMPPPAPPAQVTPSSVPDASEEASYSTSLFDKQVSTIIEMAPDIWKHTSGIKDMPNSLRVYVLLHRIISRFHVEFNHEPNLSHLIDAFSNHEVPKSLRYAPGLSCKACQVETSHQLTGAYYAKPMDRKTFNVSSLLSHFKNQHLPAQHYGFNHGQPGPMLDWKEDMIELPSERFISGLIHAPGMDDDKLLMIATVFPSLFPMPLPKIGVIGNNGLIASPIEKNERDVVAPTGVGVEAAPDKSTSGPLVSTQGDSPKPLKPSEEAYDPQRPALHTKHDDVPGSNVKTHPSRDSRDSPSGDRRQRYYNESRYYLSRDHMDDGYGRPREYVDFAPSPRMLHAGPTYADYPGRRTVFREHERMYGPPPEDILYTHAREGSHGREYGTYPRQVRYYEEDDPASSYRYHREPQQREETPLRGQSAADRFLEEFVPGPPAAGDALKASGSSQTVNKPPVPKADSEDGTHYTTPPPPGASVPEEPGPLHRQLAAPQAKAPSTMSNGSRYEDYRGNGRRNPTPDSAGLTSRRVGPHRRRDRPHEQRMPSRYYRYMSVARDDPYGRASSMSRSQSRRYEEQRRRIDQQETPQPNADRDYEPAYSRDHSVEHTSPEDSFYHRPNGREYVSVQDRLHAYSPPRYHYNEARGPPSMYVDEYGNPVHEYEVVRIRGEPRHPRGPYMPYPAPNRFEQERYEYVPMSYDRSAPQRYNSRGEYIYYEERERALPRRPVQETEGEGYEVVPPEVKVESAPVPMPEGP